MAGLFRRLRHLASGQLAVAAWLLLTAATAAAQPPTDPREANPERPTVATHAYAVAPGIVELEAGVQWQDLSGASGLLTVPMLFKVGLGHRIQLDLAPLATWVGPDGARHGGLADSAVGFKWQVASGLPILADVAFQSLLKLPTGDRESGTGTGTTDLQLLFISSRSIHGVEIDANLGYTRRSGNGSEAPRNATLWTVSAGIPVSGPLQWAVELFGYPGTSGPAGAGSIVAFLNGPTVRVNRSVVLDAGVIMNVRGFGATAVYTGVTWNMGWLPTFPRTPSRATMR